MIDTPPPVWNWRDEFNVLLRIKRDDRLDRYVTTSLRRARDFRGEPVTAEWEATYLELAATARARRAQPTWRGMAGRDARSRVNV